VVLPSQHQWLRAAQLSSHAADTGWAIQGDVSGQALSSVAAPVVSSTWEWCADKLCAGTIKANFVAEKEAVYAVHGGRSTTVKEPARKSFYYQLKPLFRYHSIGFRIASAG
jgi:hypothetical protein